MQCKHFIVDKIGFGQGIGDCQLVINYKAKGASKEEVDGAIKQHLGHVKGRPALFFYGNCFDNLRHCSRYEAGTEGLDGSGQLLFGIKCSCGLSAAWLVFDDIKNAHCPNCDKPLIGDNP
jgi:hypothetical protein